MTAQFTYTPALPTVVCQPTILSQLTVALFGGASFSLPMVPRYEDPVTLLGRFLSGMGMQAAPLAPLVKALRILSSIVGLVQAIATLDPIQIATKAAQLAQAVSDIAALVAFPLEMAQMARGFLQALIAYLQALQSQINALITRYTDVNAMIEQAQRIGNAAMLANAICAKERLDAKVAQMNAAIVALGAAVQVLSIIVCLVGAGHLPVLPTLDPNALTGAVFTPTIAALQAILAAIPDVHGSGAPC